jgi:hypothetical protein
MEVIKILGQANPSAEFNTILYSVPIDKGTVISYMNICNMDSNDAAVNIAVIRGHLPEIGVDSISYIEYGMLVYANCSSQRMKGVTLAQGDTVVVYANSEHITFNLFGSEFNQTYDYDETLPYGYGYPEI